MHRIALMSVLALTAAVSQAQAANQQPQNANPCGGCAQCGCCCTKVCRLKCEMKPQITFEYRVKCEDFCLPGPSKRCGHKWVADGKSLCGKHKEFIWQPSCSCCIRTRRLLLKVPVTKQVPVYTCEVVNLCGQCGFAQVDEAATAELRAKEILPVSAEEPLVMDDKTPAGEQKPAESVSLLSRIFSR